VGRAGQDYLHTIVKLNKIPYMEKTIRRRIMSDQKNTNQWHGIPRQEIQWYPTIVAERCIGCGLCVTSCGKNVYAFD
jgi:ferredoxin